MKRTLDEIAHSAALELAHRCGVDPKDIDMSEVIIRQAIREGQTISRAIPMPTKKNPNRGYASE